MTSKPTTKNKPTSDTLAERNPGFADERIWPWTMKGEYEVLTNVLVASEVREPNPKFKSGEPFHTAKAKFQYAPRRIQTTVEIDMAALLLAITEAAPKLKAGEAVEPFQVAVDIPFNAQREVTIKFNQEIWEQVGGTFGMGDMLDMEVQIDEYAQTQGGRNRLVNSLKVQSCVVRNAEAHPVTKAEREAQAPAKAAGNKAAEIAAALADLDIAVEPMPVADAKQAPTEAPGATPEADYDDYYDAEGSF